MTKHVVDAGGNVGGSQATKLGSYFSLMMRVDVPDENVASFTHAMDSLDDMSATVFAIDEKKDAIIQAPVVKCTYEYIPYIIIHHTYPSIFTVVCL
jgi:glycine cleavage system regulatory protein